MTVDEQELARAVSVVRRRIQEALERVGRRDSVRLVAVTKGQPAAMVQAVLRAGVQDVAENRVQQWLPKLAAVPGARWHFVGRLQSNKVHAVVGRVALVHSVDRPSLAQALQRVAERQGVIQPVLVQVNLARNSGQGGVLPEAGPELLGLLARMPHLRVLGLMTIAPRGGSAEVRAHFAALRRLRDDWAHRLGLELPELSMGMSEDYPLAVEEGATMVRIGRALFGGEAAPDLCGEGKRPQGGEA